MYDFKKKYSCFFLLLTWAVILLGNSLYAKEESKTDTFERESTRIEKLLSIKKNNHTISKIVNDGLNIMRRGDEFFLQTITYDKLLLFLIGINNIAQSQDLGHPFYTISIKAPVRIIKKAIFGGFKNKDPRIRLFALTTLKQMKLDKSEKVIRKILSLMRDETVYRTNYYYVDLYLNIHFASIAVELILLNKKLRRINITRFLKNYIFDPSSFASISEANFIAINSNIADEGEVEIPLKSFDETKLDHLISGLVNKSNYVKTECAKLIYKIYNDNKTSVNTKDRIERLLKSTFAFRREVIKESYRVDYLLKKRDYHIFIIEGSSILKEVFLNSGT